MAQYAVSGWTLYKHIGLTLKLILDLITANALSYPNSDTSDSEAYIYSKA